MRLYYVPKTRATRPRWVLEELGVPYELVRLDAAKGETRTPEHLARHPLGHVPVLEDGDVRIFESAAICLWLAERFPEKALLPPPGTAGRAAAYQWIFFAETELEPALGAISAERRKPAAEQDPGKVDAARKRFHTAAAALEPVLTGRAHLVGDALSVADVIVGAILLWGRSAGALEGLPACDAYLTGLRARPAWRRALAD
jgi:glutathione S-transferase